MLDAILSIFSGGVTGLLGVGIQRVFDWLNKREEIKAQESKQAHEVAMLKANAEVMAQEWAARTKMAETEAAGREAVADAEAFGASFNLEPKMYSERVKPGKITGAMLVFLDFVRGLVRPSLTIYLCVLTTMIYLGMRELLGDGKVLTESEAIGMLKTIISTILYLTTVVVCWWFGTRDKSQKPKVGA